MKYAIHLSTFTKEWAEDLIPYIKRAKEIGYDGVEIPLMNPKEFDIDSIKAEVEKQSIEVLCGTGLGPDTDISSTDETIRQDGIDHLKLCIDICEKLGSKQLSGVLYAPWGQLKARNEAERNYINSIEALKQVADYAEKKDVSLCLEVLNRYETYYMNTVEEGLNIINKIDRKNVGIHFDTFHAHIEEKNMYQAILTGKDRINHVHFCENTRGIPLTGQVRWDEVVQGLKEINYHGWVSIENFVNNNCQVGNGTSIWRQVEISGDEAALQGYKNMKKMFKEK